MTTKFWFLRRLDLFAGLTDQQVQQLGMLMRDRTCRVGDDVVVRPTGDRVYVLKRGRVRVMNGDIAVSILGPGQIFGTSSLFGAAASSQRIVALDEVVICEAAAGEFLAAMATHPGLAAKAMTTLARQMFELEQTVERTARHTVEMRLADLLLRLGADQRGTIRELSQDDLAKMIGASRESVSRAIARWERRGYVKASPRLIEILDEGGLRGTRSGQSA